MFENAKRENKRKEYEKWGKKTSNDGEVKNGQKRKIANEMEENRRYKGSIKEIS